MDATDAEFDQFRRVVLKGTGIDLGQYKREQLTRRLVGMVRRVNLSSLSEYAALVQRDPAMMRDFVDRLAINVSELFRNPEKYEELRTTIFPQLLKERGSLSLWSAGCSIGAEPYSLAILLKELSPTGHHRVLATDIDEGALAQAKEALYQPADVRAVPPRLLQAHLVAEGGSYRVRDDVRRMVQLKQHNLLRDPFPTGMDFIACRNVVIYFSEEAKDQLYTRFFQALRPGGVLFIGSTERINKYREIGYEQTAAFFYRRPANAPVGRSG